MKRSYVLLVACALALNANADVVLRQSTASQAVVLGPFVDTAGAVVSGLTLANTDIRLSKNGADIVAKNSGGCTYDEVGMYTCTFDATDSNTAGRLQVTVNKTGALPVYAEFQVATQSVFDSCCASGAAPPTFPTNFASMAITGGGAVTAGTISDKTGYSLTQTFPSNFSSLAITGGGAVTAGTVSDKTGYGIASGGINRAAFNTDTNPLFGIAASGTAQAATGTTLTLASGSTVKPGWTLNIISGTTGAGETAVVTSVSGSGTSTPVATFSGWAGGVTPTGTVGYVAYGTALTAGGGGSGPDAATIADAVLDEILSGHTVSGSLGERIGRIPNAAAGGNGGLPTANASNQVTALLSPGTGAGQVSLASGAVLLQPTQTGVTIPNVTTVTNVTNAPTAGDLTATMKTSVQTAATASLNASAIKTTTDKLDTALEADGGVYRYTANALEQAPAGGGGGTSDWTVDERTAIKSILGVPNSGTTPVNPTVGVLDSIRDDIAAQNNLSIAQVRDMIVEDQGASASLSCVNAVALAVLAGRASVSGNTVTYRDPSNGEVRAVITHDASGNRSAASITCPTY